MNPSSSRGFVKRSFRSPTKPDTLGDKLISKTEIRTPLADRFGFTVIINQPVLSRVVVLLSPRSPSAIFCVIVSRIVDSIKARSVWSYPHILKKVFKVPPLLTVRNPSSTVPRKIDPVPVFAPGLHGLPALVCRTVRETMYWWFSRPSFHCALIGRSGGYVK